MNLIKKPVCPICYLSSDGDECRHCGKVSPHPSLWPQPVDFMLTSPPTGNQLSPRWQRRFHGGVAIGFVVHLVLALLIWIEGVEIWRIYFGGYPAAVQYLIFWTMTLSPALPAFIVAFLPATKGKAFSYGMLVGSATVFLLQYLLAASLASWFPFNS